MLPAKKYFFIVFLILPFCLYAQYRNVRINDPSTHNAEEVSIALNPTNPANLIAGANIDYSYYSFDEGLTWSPSTLLSNYGIWGDPCVIYDAVGNAYFGHLSNASGSTGDWLDRIIIQRSKNGGVSWNLISYTGLNPPRDQDKHWLVADQTSSPFRNRLYVSWTQFDKYGSNNSQDSSRILFSYSTNSDSTWSEPVRVSDRAGTCLDDDNTVEGAVPAVGPNGEVYLAWSGTLGIMFDKSYDGGKTFGRDSFVTSQPSGWDFSVSGIYRCNGMPITACDVSNSPNRGNIYIGWSDQRNGAMNTDIFFIKSINGGKSWGAVKKVNNDVSGRHQFFTWMSVDQVSGNIYYVFYDRRSTTGDATDVYMARSTDGGETFTNFKVSETSFTPTENIFFGDYINVTARNGIVRPIWMRMDGNDLSVWTAIVNDTAGQVYIDESPSHFDFSLLQNYPNPFSPVTDIPFTLSASSHVEVLIYNSVGEAIRHVANKFFMPGMYHLQWNGRTDEGEEAQPGVYFCMLKTENGIAVRKMVLVR